MTESYWYFGLELKGLVCDEDGDWTPSSVEIVDYIQGELNTLVIDLAREGIKIRTVSIDQEGKVND